jgi:hypothetical protein
MSQNSISEIIENELSVLIGEQIIQFRRVALMLGADFSNGAEVEQRKDSKRDEMNTGPRYTLHVHSSWRLLKDGDICLGQSDLFNRELSGFKSCEQAGEAVDNVEFARISKKLNETFANTTVRVVNVEATELGDLKIYMEDRYCLELFVDSAGDAESWRFFRNDDSSGHFVIFDNGTE